MRAFLQRLIFVWLVSCLAVRGAVQIGIVTVGDSSRDAASLLTVGLSKMTNVSLIERDEVDKAFRERALADSQHADIASLGQVLHADGLVLVEEIKSAGATTLAVRLIAVNSGVVLDAALYPYPLPDPAHWTEVASGRLGRFVAKLDVQKDQAIPISILNLHAAVATPAAAQTERELSTLLFHRLVAEPEVFVLERRQLGRAQWEKTLALDESAFWNGGYLLEGVIDSKGTADNTITINATLHPPKGGKPINIEVSGPRLEPARVTELLAQRILEALHTRSAAELWDRDGEAERFEQESMWAMRWHMWPEAYASAESSWALGRHTETVVTYKVKSLLQQIQPDDEWVFDPVKFIRYSNRGHMTDPIRNVMWTTNVPAGGDIPLTMEAVSTYGGVMRSPEFHWQTNAAWLDLGSNVLATASLVIRHQYLYGWPSNSFDPDLPVLRQETRDFATLLPKSRAQPLLLRRGACWQETPLAATRMYCEALNSGAPGAAGMLFFSRDAYDPIWVGWTPLDREQGEHQWNDFITELQSSTNQAERANGALFKLYSARFDPDIALASEEFLDAAMDEHRSRFSTNIDFTMLDSFDQILSDKCVNPFTLRRGRLWESWKSCEFARLKNYLQTARVHNVDRAGWPYANHTFTPEQAKELLPVVDEYIHRIGGDWMQTVRDHVASEAAASQDEFDAFFAEPVFDAARFHRVFVEHTFTLAEAKRLVYPVRAYANRMGWTDDLVAVDTHLHAMLAEEENRKTNDITMPATAVLTVTNQLHPMYLDSRGEEHPAHTGPWLEHEGKIIMVSEQPGTGTAWPPVSGEVNVIIMDLETGESKTFAQPLSVEKYQRLSIQLIGDQFFWVDGDSKIGILDMKSGAADEYPVDLPLRLASLTALDGRLFITSADYIAEFNLRDHSLKLLASKRRKPAVNRLDDWDGWSVVPKLWLDEKGGVCANVGATNLWSYDSTNGAWNEMPPLSGHAGIPWTFSYRGDFSSCLDERVWVDGARETILSPDRARSPRWPMPFDYPLTLGMSMGNGAQHLFDGTNLCLLLSPKVVKSAGNQTFLETLKDRDLTLLWFDPRWEMPVPIPLHFENQKAMASRDGTRRTGLPGELPCTPTSRGLLFASSEPFFSQSPMWFISWKDLREWAATHQPENQNLARNDIAPGYKSGRDEAWESRRFLLTFDTDHDGRLDTNEIAVAATFDKNFLPQERYQTFFPAGLPSSRSKLDQWMEACDANRDSVISGDEVLALYRYITMPQSQFHGSPNGFIPQSTTRSNDSNIRHQMALDKYDRNHNGKIDPEERHEMLPPKMQPFDRDSNGVVSPEEFQAFIQSQQNAKKNQTNAPAAAP